MLGLNVFDVGRTCRNPMAAVFGCPENIRVRLLKPAPRQLYVILKPIKVKDIHIDYEPMRDVGTSINGRHLVLSAINRFLDRTGAVEAQCVYHTPRCDPGGDAVGQVGDLALVEMLVQAFPEVVVIWQRHRLEGDPLRVLNRQALPVGEQFESPPIGGYGPVKLLGWCLAPLFPGGW